MYQIANLCTRFATLFAALLVVAVTSTAYAAPEAVDAKVLSHFSSSFANAKSVTWKVTKAFSKATFTNNNKRTEVFYNAKDKLIGTSVYIDFKDLPRGTEDAIASNYEAYNMATAIEYTDAEEVMNYYVEIENDKRTIVLQVTPQGDITEVKSTHK